MADMPVIVRHQDRGALRLDHRHDQALCRAQGRVIFDHRHNAADRADPGLRERSELSWPVDVGAVLDGYDGDQALLAVDAVDHAVIPAACALKSLKAELQQLAGAVRASGQRASQERLIIEAWDQRADDGQPV